MSMAVWAARCDCRRYRAAVTHCLAKFNGSTGGCTRGSSPGSERGRGLVPPQHLPCVPASPRGQKHSSSGGTCQWMALGASGVSLARAVASSEDGSRAVSPPKCCAHHPGCVPGPASTNGSGSRASPRWLSSH